MTSILKKQLTILGAATILGGGAVWNSGVGRAQDKEAMAVPTDAKPDNPQNDATKNAMAQFLSVFARARENSRRSSCQSNLKQISLGVLQYTQDYDEKLPPAKHWIDVVRPYIKSEPIFNCPSIPSGKRYGYAYNSRLSIKTFGVDFDSTQTVSIYETSVLKRNAYGMGENPAFRHLGGANYAFVDGHVEWLIKTQIPRFKLKH